MSVFRSKSTNPSLCGFTILEMMISVVVLTIILWVIFTITQQTAKVYTDTSGQMESFRAARNAFESMTRSLSLATLNNYYDYVDANGVTRAQAIQNSQANSFNPSTYGRVSDLHFVSGDATAAYDEQTTHSVFFQAPIGYTNNTNLNGLENLLSACGYYVQYREDPKPPNFVTAPPVYRYSLMEFIQPAETLSVFSTGNTSWFTNPLKIGPVSIPPVPAPVHPIAPNVIALLIRPQTAGTDTATDPIINAVPDFNYDSRLNTSAAVRHQLPPILDVCIVAISEPSAVRFGQNSATPPSVIQDALTSGGRFTDAASLDTDLSNLQDDLSSERITFRVFRTLLPLRNSKWSSK